MSEAMNIFSMTKKESLDVISKSILIDSGYNEDLLEKYIYAKNLAFAIDFGANLDEAKKIALIKSSKFFGYDILRSKILSEGKVDLYVYDNLLNIFYGSLSDQFKLILIKKEIKKIKVLHLNKKLKIFNLMLSATELDIPIQDITKTLGEFL